MKNSLRRRPLIGFPIARFSCLWLGCLRRSDSRPESALKLDQEVMFHFCAILVQVITVIVGPVSIQNALFLNKIAQKTTLSAKGRKEISIQFFENSLCDLEPVGVSEHVAIARDEPADFAGHGVIAVPLQVANVPSIDMDA